MGYYDNVLKLRLEALYNEVSERKQTLEKEIILLPAGNLRIKKNKGRSYYTQYYDGKTKYITKNLELVEKLYRKENLSKELCYCERWEHLLGKAVFEADRIGFCKEVDVSAQEWLAKEQQTNPLYPEALKYLTESGQHVRSKSERTIADWLYRYNLPFKYEAGIEHNGQMFWPDFTIRKANGEIVLWEHFGLMTNPKYYYKALEKIRKYREMGYVQHKNLICTWEEDLMQPHEIQIIIEKFLL